MAADYELTSLLGMPAIKLCQISRKKPKFVGGESLHIIMKAFAVPLEHHKQYHAKDEELSLGDEVLCTAKGFSPKVLIHLL